MIFKQRNWILFTTSVLVVYAAASLMFRPGYPLTIMGDFTEFLLIAGAGALVARNAFTSRGQVRIFWLLMMAGAILWGASSASWTWFEVVLRRSIPDPFFADVILFIHIVPFMAAVAIRPHHAQPHQAKTYSSTLNFFILLVWWMFLYAFAIFPNQYVVFNQRIYGRNFDTLYLIECSVLILTLAALAAGSKDGWRKLYWNLFVSFGLYTWGSLVINKAITHGRYTTGSWYDIPLVAALCWFILSALLGYRVESSVEDQLAPSKWQALSPRLAMVAILSLPVIGFWSLFFDTAPSPIRRFRLLTTLSAMLVLGVFVFLRQYILDRELVRLLEKSRRGYEDLTRLQTQVIQREKLASLGQLVAGAAHEINNPLAAILGYSELLAADRALDSNQVNMAQKIGQQARRTRDLVSGLLSFAQQAPGEKSMIEIGPIVERCLKMKVLQLETAGIHVQTTISEPLPPIYGNSNQLMQCCLELIDNAMDAMEGMPGAVLSVRARREKDEVVLEFADTGTGIREPQRVFDPFYTTKPIGKGTGLGLSATYGVVQDHQGQITCYNQRYGGAAFVMRFPIPASQIVAAKDRLQPETLSAS